jgi:hypothetical protein
LSTFSSKELRSSEYWRFLKSFGMLIVIPSVIAALLVELLAWRTGALATGSVDRIAELEHEDPGIAWTGPGQLYGPLALARIAIERPDIVIIGHSRCGQLRSMMFKPYSFHNACVVAWTFDQIKTVIDLATRSGGPKTILFTLDYYMFGEKYAKRWQDRAFMDFSPASQRSHLDGLLALASAFKRRPVTMLRAMPSYLLGRAREPVDGLELFGPDAIAGDSGLFRSDGSLLYDEPTRSLAPFHDVQLDRVLAQVANGDGEQPSAAQMTVLKEIGELGRQRNLTIVGIQLPYIQGVLRALNWDQDWNGYRAADRGVWRLLQTAAMREELNAMGISYFDLSQDPISNDARAFIDPGHPSEYGIASAIVDAMNDAEFRAIFPRLDVGALQAALAEARRQERFIDVYGAQF